MKLTNLTLLVLLLLVQGRLWIGDESVAELKRLDRTIASQRAENAALEERNRRLAAEVRDLKDGLDAVEERARRELGMVHERETYFHFVEN